eukprot:CAMPEP_0194205324 /NCGR_PEP_ID=MMETSP0156-20130528/4631_1 /TAXON_ID=33649 /ORGANISM="Thalassionema nitzschioides, Strain L26-B" /LENGTH=389 /DNA_ID=CAMNT_0038931571 /DNA_START=103 /DNA_END=1272 /DNA_ORIENTATION=+
MLTFLVLLLAAKSLSLSLLPVYVSPVRPRVSLFPSFSEYMLERDIKIFNAAWSHSNTPIQQYAAKIIDEDRRRPKIDITNQTLSKSSRYLSQHQDELSKEERERLESKIQAEARASRKLDPKKHLRIIYADSDICVVYKPSGVLCVPGPRRNPSVANLVYDAMRPFIDIDQTVVHRIDMDTSGIVVFALTEVALKQLHADFRDRVEVQKTYHALLCGHISSVGEGEIDLPLERDPIRPPFMRVALEEGGRPTGENNNKIVGSFQKEINKAPKPSLTTFRVLSREVLEGEPVTRVELKPYTGRTHQLRVHCAAIGHPIVGDDIYGLGGEGSLDAGLRLSQIDLFADRAPIELQQRIIDKIDKNLCLHAAQLNIRHPISRAPMVFKVNPNF